MALLGLVMLIFQRMQFFRPSGDPFRISCQTWMLSSTERSRRWDSMPSMRSCTRKVHCWVSF